MQAPLRLQLRAGQEDIRRAKGMQKKDNRKNKGKPPPQSTLAEGVRRKSGSASSPLRFLSAAEVTTPTPRSVRLSLSGVGPAPALRSGEESQDRLAAALVGKEVPDLKPVPPLPVSLRTSAWGVAIPPWLEMFHAVCVRPVSVCFQLRPLVHLRVPWESVPVICGISVSACKPRARYRDIALHTTIAKIWQQLVTAAESCCHARAERRNLEKS